MKIIELLNKIANGEEVPKKIRYEYKEFEFIGGAYEDEKGNDLCYYDDSCMYFLNDAVEILEKEKKIPEKLPIYDCTDAYSKFDIDDNRKAINQIIDYLKIKGDE